MTNYDHDYSALDAETTADASLSDALMSTSDISARAPVDGFDPDALVSVAYELSQSVFAPAAADWDRNRTYCWDNIEHLKRARLMGMTIPKAYGGLGASFLDAARVIEAVGEACTLTARIVVEANMGGVSAIMAYGSEHQKRLAAGIVLDGDKPAICITEPDAGSAATEMKTVARRVDGGYRISGRKHWITGGGVSRLHLVFARRHSA